MYTATWADFDLEVFFLAKTPTQGQSINSSQTDSTKIAFTLQVCSTR